MKLNLNLTINGDYTISVIPEPTVNCYSKEGYTKAMKHLNKLIALNPLYKDIKDIIVGVYSE
jgi:hypothetical protein